MIEFHGAKTKVRVGSELSEEFSVQVGVHQRSVLSPRKMMEWALSKDDGVGDGKKCLP